MCSLLQLMNTALTTLTPSGYWYRVQRLKWEVHSSLKIRKIKKTSKQQLSHVRNPGQFAIILLIAIAWGWQRSDFCCFSQGSSKSSLSYSDSVVEKLLESPDLKPQETWGKGKRPEITYTVLLWVTTGGPHCLQVQPRKSLYSSESFLWKIPSCQAHPQLWYPTHRRVIKEACTSKETTELVNCLFPAQEPSQPNPTSKFRSPRVLPAWKLMKQQIEQRADDMAIKLATLETPGKQQEWPKLMVYSISSSFGITVLTAINRAHERSRQSTGQPCSTLNWQHQGRVLHSVQLIPFIPDFQHLHNCSPDQTSSLLPSTAYWFILVPFSLCSFRAPWYNFPAKPVLRTHNLRFSQIPPPRTRTELKSSESSGQHLGSSSPGSEEAARKLRLAIYLCRTHMTHNFLWECE